MFNIKTICYFLAGLFVNQTTSAIDHTPHQHKTSSQRQPEKCLGNICLGDQQFNYTSSIEILGEGQKNLNIADNIFHRQRCYWMAEAHLSLVLGYASNQDSENSPLNGILITHTKLCHTAPSITTRAHKYKNLDIKNKRDLIKFSIFNQQIYLGKKINTIDKKFITKRYAPDPLDTHRHNEILINIHSNADNELLYNEIGFKHGKVNSILVSNSP